ncbi:MAG: FAD/NAD(P)-binding protein [Alphaproteobacteria bacterium]
MLNIIGGGLSGTTFAIHAMEQQNAPQTIRIFEPVQKLGYGAAYEPNHPTFRLNVPSSVMKMNWSNHPELSEWVDTGNAGEVDFRATLPDGRKFYKRRLFGNYLSETFENAVRGFSGKVEHIRETLTTLPADETNVLASGVGEISQLGQPTHYGPTIIQNPYNLDQLKEISANASVLIVGSGLTALDIAAYLSHENHAGKIEMISRSGRLPLVDAVKIDEDAVSLPTENSAAAWLKTRRTHCMANSNPFAAFSDVRADLRENWHKFPEEMQVRLLRHGLGFWNILRFRASPQTMGAWARLKQRKQARLTKRGYNAGTETADIIINCTGPKVTNPFNLPLNPAAVKSKCDFGLDLNLNASVKGQSNLYAVGATARSIFADLYGGPDISWQAKRLAEHLYA